MKIGFEDGERISVLFGITETLRRSHRLQQCENSISLIYYYYY